ncbi:uncharacterized protein LOC126998310 [Eriocheir sinensis]|uniref:uncharacterized protein LOC126998310 n=1 Tax=Eriocheir sinensis TaxID=95602 RepID=UPI0021C6FB0D|nr:uncharacterized protein LOC126998310 [Eriocheir sinensis]
MNQYPNNNTKTTTTTTTHPSTSNTTTPTHHQQYYPQHHYNALFSSNGSSGGGGGGGPRPTPTITTLNTSSSVGVMGVGVDERLRHLLTTVPESALSSAHWVSRTGRSSSFSTSTPLIPPRPPHLSSSSTTTPRMPPPRRHPSSIFSSSSTNSTPYQTPHPPPPHPNISSSSPLMPPPPPPPPKVPHSSSSSFFPTLLHSSASTMDSSVLAPPPGSTHILNSGMGGGRKRPMAPPSASTSSSSTTPAPPPRPSLPPQPPPLDLSDDLAAQGHLSMDEEPSQVLMSLSWTRGKLGAAFYDVTTEQVYVVEDKVEAAPDFWVLRCLFREQRPRCMLVGGRQDQRLFEVLRELCGGAVGVPSPYNNNKHTPPQAGGGGDGGGGVAGRRTTTTTNNTTNNSTSPSSSTTSFTSSSSSCHLRILPMGDFKYELCVRRVLSLSLPGEPEGATEGERELFVRGLVNTHLRAMTRALGALLRFLDVHGAEIAAPGHLLEATPVLGIHVYVMEDMAQLDEATAVALQVFSEEQHPAASKSGKPSASKEGLSLYALLSRTACPMARHTLRRVLLRPLVEVGALEGRYAAVGWGVDSANMDTLKQLQACLRHVSNVSYTVGRLHRGQLGVRDWKVLYKSLFNAILIGEICQAQDQGIPIFKQEAKANSWFAAEKTYLKAATALLDDSSSDTEDTAPPHLQAQRKRRGKYMEEVMPCPKTPEDWKKIVEEFGGRWQFYNCIGALDGKHTAIKSPRNQGSVYYNYKGFHSIILLALVDAGHKFIFIDCGSNGSASDSGVFRDTQLFKKYTFINHPERGDEQLGEQHADCPGRDSNSGPWIRS